MKYKLETFNRQFYISHHICYGYMTYYDKNVSGWGIPIKQHQSLICTIEHHTARHINDYLSISCDISVVIYCPGLQPYEVPIHSEIHDCSKEHLSFLFVFLKHKTVREPLGCVATKETIWSFGLLWKSSSQSTLCLTLETLPVLHYGCSLKSFSCFHYQPKYH